MPPAISSADSTRSWSAWAMPLWPRPISTTIASCRPRTSPTAREPASSQRLGQQRQTDVHAVIDRGMIVVEFLVSVGNAGIRELPAHDPRAVDHVVLVDIAAIDVEGLQLAQVVLVLE